MSYLWTVLERVAKEPPLRLLARGFIKRLPVSVKTKAYWDAVARPHYLTGVLGGTDEALRQRVRAISVFEFGVAGGAGLVALQEYAEQVEQATGVIISVYGFDNGAGLPRFVGDYRDHPDRWRVGDYPMDETRLRSRLTKRTTLVLGDIEETLPSFVAGMLQAPVGFVAIDVDLYSSTLSALKLFTLSRKRMLRRVPMYFDDIDFFFNHRYAGELLAIETFNKSQNAVKIDVWRGLSKFRPFPESPWLKKMYMAHDIEALSLVEVRRERPLELPLEPT